MARRVQPSARSTLDEPQGGRARLSGRRRGPITEQASNWRVVVSVIDPEPAGWGLPPADPHDGTFVAGGVRTLHELAVAAAVSGREVELRGPVSLPTLDALADAAGARPELPTEERRPTERDIVVMLGGGHEVLRFARLVLSPARFVLALLAPPGLTGWPFVSGWRPPSGLTVPLDSVARPEHFRAMAALGVDLWTHMATVQERADAVGARCAFIGNGDPLPPAPPPPVKDVPVVYLEASGWRSLAEEVAARMQTPVQAIPKGDHETVMAALARAHVLIWPARVTGHGRVLWEARARGTVVVGLSSNIYATGLDEASGAIAVDSLEQMPGAVESLLADPERLDALAQAGLGSAREQVDWARYVERVDAAVAATEQRPEDAAASARAAIGESLAQPLEERLRAIDRVGELDAALAQATARVGCLDGEFADAREALRELGSQLHLAESSIVETSAALADARANPVGEARSLALLNELARRARRRLAVRP